MYIYIYIHTYIHTYSSWMLKATSKLCEGSQLRRHDVFVGAGPDIFHLTGGIGGKVTLKLSPSFYEIVQEHRDIQHNRFMYTKHCNQKQTS
jgi:hypothetical protein